MQWQWWITNLLHIESLFIIGIIIVIIYLLCTKDRRHVGQDFSHFLQGTSISQGLIKKKKKKRRVHKSEEKCREVFERIFRARFKSVRPDWLKNPVTGQNLELDGYNEDIRTPLGKGLAFEYDGEQHAKYNKHFHRNGPNEFMYQVKKDSWKDIRCKEKGVLLVRIPHFVVYHDIERYIQQKLITLGFDVDSGVATKKKNTTSSIKYAEKMSHLVGVSQMKSGMYD